MKKQLRRLFFQFGILVQYKLSSQQIAEALKKDGLIEIVDDDRYIETEKMKQVQVLRDYVKELLEKEVSL